ncbi:MAG TPA: ABC transporter substrate-binding protein [Propionibacteriaceae bacterium]|nr:ABC transporter substrate-binding protein [Propionibacteriaceae bacterium]
MRTRITAIALILLTLVGCSSAASPGTTTSTASGPAGTASTAPAVIGLTYIPNVQFSPFYVATSSKLYSTPVTLRHHGTSEGLFTAMTTGSEQFVVAGGDEVLQAREQGTDLVAVASYYRSYPVRVIVRGDSPISTIADLKGHTVGIPGKYGESWFGFLMALKGAGLSVNDVTVQEIGYTQQAALATKKVDAIVGFVNSEPIQLQAAGIAAKTIDIGNVPLVSICLVTTHAYATAHPDVVKAVVKGTVAGMQSVVSDQDQALQASTAYVPGLTDPATAKGAKAVLAATAPLFQNADGTVSGALDAKAWDAMSSAMVGAGLLKAPQAAASAMTDEYMS